MISRHYSPRIREALEISLARHEGQRRKAAPVPLASHVMGVAVILLRYGCDEDTVIAGLLHDVVEDCVTEEWSRDRLIDLIGRHFGDRVLIGVLDVTEVKVDPQTGEPRPSTVRKREYLDHLRHASEVGLLVCAADKIDNAESLILTLQGRPHDEVWSLFSSGREGTLTYLASAATILRQSGLEHPILDELDSVIERLLAVTGETAPA